MDRRTFNAVVGLGGLKSVRDRLGLSLAPSPAAEPQTQQVPWPSRTFRRLLIDTHVPDWDHLLADFDAGDYVSTIAGAGFQSLLQYANSHVGLCLWRTKLGQMHAGMQGRDYFGEITQECHRHNLHVSAYYSVIFDDWAFQNHPEWRVLPEDGYDRQMFSRTATVCPNSPYREQAFACLRELVGNYEVEGVFIDMTFWPAICYCPYCTERFRQQAHAEPPRIIDWNDPLWRAFQSAREGWMREFANAVTQTIKQTRPIPVNHQFGTAFASWEHGVSLEQREASDSCSGDFYGGAAQFSLVCKAYYGLTEKRPFEFMTSRCTSLNDFETMKPYEIMLTDAMIPTIHGGSYLLIDAIKPNGTLNHGAYQFIGGVNRAHDAYEAYLGGDLVADVAIYYDKQSLYDPGDNGLHAAEASPADAFGGPRKHSFDPGPRKNLPHLDAVVGCAKILREAHIPFGVVTNVTLDQLSFYRAVLVPSVFELTAEQAERFRKFVHEGGVIYVSGPSSLDRFERIGTVLADVLGVKYTGTVGTLTTYLTASDPELKKVTWPQENITYPGPCVLAELVGSPQVVATVTPPLVAPEVGYAIGTHFAQIWSNPPALTAGTAPGIVLSTFGKGKAVWVAAPIESRPEPVYANIVTQFLKKLLPGPYSFEVDADPAVEMTLFHQPDQHRLLVSQLNMREEVPVSPVAATVRVRLPADRNPKRVLGLPDLKEIPFEIVGPYVQYRVAPFKIVAMQLVEYR